MARILLVNDDIAEISAVKRVLARAGHQPVLATNARDALTSVQQVPPDLLVVGATCEGGSALRRLAADQAASGIRLVVLGEPAGAPPGTAALARPVDPGQLADQVAASLAAAPPAPATSAPPARTPAARPARAAARPPVPANGRPAPDAAATRKAAAEALRARAAELRRATSPALEAVPSGASTAAGATATAVEVPAAAAPGTTQPSAGTGLDVEDSGLEAILRRAEEAERAHAAERKARARQADRATVEAAQRAEAERVAVEKASRARAAEARVRSEERARAEAERKAAAEAAARKRAEDERSATEERARREAEEEGRRATEAEERARAEEEARRSAEAKAREETEARRRAEAQRRAAEAQRRTAEAERRAAEERGRTAEAERRAAEERGRRGTEEEARRAAEARERARAETDARKRLEQELEQLRGQVEAERRTAEEKIQSVLERAAAEERAAEDLRRMAEEQAQRHSEEEARRRQSEEEQLRAAIASARAEMETLRKKSEEDARRRADAEAEVARLAREAQRRAAEAAAQPAPFDLPVYRPPDDEPVPDPGEEAARKRVAALRGEPERAVVMDPAPPPPEGPPAAAEEPPARRVRPPPPELRAGTFADVPAPRLLALAGRASVSGRFDVEGEVARSFWLEDGRVVGAASADPTERVEELALRLGLVTRDQHRQIASAAAALPTRRAALLLLERGFLKPTELTPVVRRRTEEVVFGTFADAGARFRWAAEEVPPEERIALERDTLALAVEGVRRRWLAPQVEAVLGGAGTLLAPVSAGPTVQDLSLSAEERRAVALADGLRTLDEILAASPLDPLSTRQVLAALVLVGSLAVRVFQGGKPAAAATTAIDLARVREKVDQVRRADYFTILGVSRLCTPHEVRQACERLSDEFDPRRYQGIREDGLTGRLDEILRVVADAREILVDDRLRNEYLRGLGDER